VSAIPADRAVESREQASRKPYVYRPPSQLPDVKDHPDWTARWIRFRIKAGVDDPGNLGRQRRDGYEPVSFERRAEVLEDPDSVYQSASGNIEIGDLILCRRDSYKSKGRKQYFENLTQQQIRGAKQEFQKQEDPRYPGTTEGKTKISAQVKAKQVDFGDD